MLFNSYEFIFFFLPIVFVGFFALAPYGHRLAALWLAAASLFFYGWWDARYVLLLFASISFNYAMGYVIGHARSRTAYNHAKLVFIAAITCDLFVLGYFKYTDFFIGTMNAAAGTDWRLMNIVLPLGISFFTFTQIAFLTDVYRGIAREYNFLHYLLFVSYFPHLIAGPVLHHKQMMPQFGRSATYRFDLNNINMGLSIFTIGLFKKVILADQFALYANPVFEGAAGGRAIQLPEAWIGALAYTLQLYFDFSGYSDMAIGMSKMFNISLPVNFDSPYKSLSIIDFWRRWHMTLSAFLRDYLYFPLGGNRHGVSRRYANLMVTMVLGGLWHGANWTFVLWGTLHGFYLVINHSWRALSARLKVPTTLVAAQLAWLLTFVAVVVAWVFFRAHDMRSGFNLLGGMVGLNGAIDRESYGAISREIAFSPLTIAAWIVGGLVIVKFLPNSLQIADRMENWQLRGRTLGFVVGAVLVFVLMNFNRVSSFIYFQF